MRVPLALLLDGIARDCAIERKKKISTQFMPHEHSVKDGESPGPVHPRGKLDLGGGDNPNSGSCLFSRHPPPFLVCSDDVNGGFLFPIIAE